MMGGRSDDDFDPVYFRKEGAINIRKATAADAATLHVWDEKPHVRKAVSLSGESSFEADWAEEITGMDASNEFLIAELDGHPIGAMQLIDPAREPTHYWCDVDDDLRAIDIWIGEEDCLGKGYGTVMMSFAINRCFSSAEVNAILIDPLINNTDAHRFYARFGFEILERRQFDDERDCLVLRLERSRFESLTLTGSP